MERYGYCGKILRVNLSKKEIGDENIDPKTIDDYVGGVGFGAKYLYDENIELLPWSDPKNRLILMSGPLGNTPIGGSGTTCFVTKGPMTNLAVSTQANGYLGAYLKSCGYDGIIITGKAEKWSYIYISDNLIEIRDASKLIGRDTIETQEILKRDLERDHGISIFCIGPAGENLVKFSVIVGDGTHTASKNGVGAVMGSKNIKAIVACRGKFKQKIYDKSGLIQSSKELHGNAITYLDGSRHKWGTNGTFSNLHKVGALPVKNYTTNIFPGHEKLSGQYVRENFKKIKRNTCFNCGINHIYTMEVTEGPYKGFVAEEPEYEAAAAFGSQIGQNDMGAVFYLTDLVDRLGLDINEAGWVLGWTMECIEKGIIKISDTDNIEIKWGDVNSVIKILNKIAKRDGIGDLLAEGVKRASEAIGGDAKKMAVYTEKGTTPRGHDHRARWHELVDTCMSNTSTLEATFVGVRPHLLGMPSVAGSFSPWEVPLINAVQNGWAIIEDCMGACRFNITHPENVVKAYNLATGSSKNIKDMLKTGKRIVNILRMFNIKNGLTAKIEMPSARYGSAPVDGPAKGISILDNWEHIREIYYNAMGWNPKTGIPTPETLRELDLNL
jgi:aldehyde:ferredoxin oxidoreductase